MLEIKTVKGKILIVGGPTATGKTDIAVKLAKENNGELINADSRQVYKYLKIGTNVGDIKFQNNYRLKLNDEEGNKDLENIEVPLHTINSIPIHLIQFLDLNKRFSVFEFKSLASALIEDIFSRGKVPIVVGGTGLYIDSLIKDYPLNESTDNVDNYALRNELENKGVDELQKMLPKNILESMNESDRQNKRRLIRKIEKLNSKSKVIDFKKFSENEVFEYTFYYPKFNWDDLKERINSRVEQMFKDGLVEETRRVLEMGYSKDAHALTTMGYKEVIQYLNNEISLDECIELVKIAHRQYARRQRTWFEGEGRGYELEFIDHDAI